MVGYMYYIARLAYFHRGKIYSVGGAELHVKANLVFLYVHPLGIKHPSQAFITIVPMFSVHVFVASASVGG